MFWFAKFNKDKEYLWIKTNKFLQGIRYKIKGIMSNDDGETQSNGFKQELVKNYWKFCFCCFFYKKLNKNNKKNTRFNFENE